MPLSEIVGYIATVIVLISWFLTDQKQMRIVNIFGAAGWIVSGILSGSLSLIVFNATLSLLQLYRLYELRGGK